MKFRRLLQFGQGLEIPARSALGRFGRRGEHRRAELALDLNRDAHEHEAPHHVEDDMAQNGADDHDGQHDERVDAAAGQHAVGNIEKIDRDREDQEVHPEGKEGDHQQFHPRRPQPSRQDFAEVPIPEAFLQRRRGILAATGFRRRRRLLRAGRSVALRIARRRVGRRRRVALRWLLDFGAGIFGHACLLGRGNRIAATINS